jgi:periodic tryptophan protein 1
MGRVSPSNTAYLFDGMLIYSMEGEDQEEDDEDDEDEEGSDEEMDEDEKDKDGDVEMDDKPKVHDPNDLSAFKMDEYDNEESTGVGKLAFADP